MSNEKTILVIDDDPNTLFLVGELLKKHGYRVVSATDSQYGVKMAMVEEPDVIVLDVNLPPYNGFHVCRILKDDHLLRHIPVIILSARSDEIDKAIAQEVGADYYLCKPIKTEELLNKINSFI